MKMPEMDKYNSILGERYDAAVQCGDLHGQRLMLIEASEYLSSLPSNQPMYGDHQGGFCLAGELLENVDRHIQAVEEKLMDAYHEELQREYEQAQSNKQSYADEMREEYHREMMRDCYGVEI